MKSFLERVAEHLIEHYPDRISNICIVLSNRRASLFLKKYLAELLGKTSWGPNIFSIEDFIQELSEYQSINTLKTTFELYEVHKTIEGKHAQGFDEFYKWGSILVQDFNEVDLHMVDAERMYNYLSEVKSLAEWNLEIENLSSFQNNYLKFFNSLKTYYILLNERLNKRKLAYNGKLFRHVAENIEARSKSLEWDQILFAGFNALSLAEEKILFSLKELGSADFLWDVDDYYLNHTNFGVKHEAGLFFRKYFENQKESEISWVDQNLKNDKKDIQIYGIPKQIGQAKFCGQLLQQDSHFLTAKHKSAIILADENLLIPVLNSIPSTCTELNVTMGLPLSSSPLFGFFNQLFKMQLYAENKKKMLNLSDPLFRYSDISKCLRHSVISNLSDQLFNGPKISIQHILTQIKITGQLDFKSEDLLKAFKAENYKKTFLTITFKDWKDNPVIAIQCFQGVIEIFRDATINKQLADQIDLKIELELLYQFSILFNKIEGFISEYGSINTIKIFHSIFLQICSSQKLPLYGEPLKGLQLMGMLESRNLDFDNLIILSVNENILPSSGKQNSFIPFELKREFNIPTHREKNAIFAYHFFRLLQRSKNITLIYNSQPDPLAGGDKSRFLHQIIDELALYNPQISIAEKTVSSIIKLSAEQPISIPKTKGIFQRLDEISKNGISASSLNIYIRCQLQFYFKQIAQLGEPDEVSDTIDAAMLGTVIHEALKNFYVPFINKVLNPEELKINLKMTDQYIVQAFKTHYNQGNTKFGKNLLIVHVAKELFRNFIQHEINEFSKPEGQKTEKIITSLEKKFASILTLNLNGEPKDVKLKGFIDRIQMVNGITEVVDYKTGAIKPKDLKLDAWNELISDKKNDKVFQLLLYAWILNKNVSNHNEFIAGIYPLKRISNGFIKVQTPDQNQSTLTSFDLNEFELQLTKLLVEIYNPKLNFEQTDDLNNCLYCTYRSICNK
ncbi:MAG: PD-(D/E)XK nuclease family protein [Bacteroidetes bacterium]|nr:PD-(D/E)XK nuclease family protein [Bacteroidota bacterium]